MFSLQPSDPLPGLRVRTNTDWAAVQQAMQAGASLSPLLPLGNDAALVWIPKNGCSSLKRAWLQLRFGVMPNDALLDDVHGAVQVHNHWLRPEERKAVAQHRAIVAIWRDPIDRFVSACRSHLVELTTGRIAAKLRSHAGGDEEALQASLQFHQHLFHRHGVSSFRDEADPVAVMNQVAQQLPAWIPCHIDWSHHTLPQVSFLGGDPSVYRTILGMEQIQALIAHWGQASGVALDLAPQHVSQPLEAADSWRRLRRDQLTPEALAALEQFYAPDRAFLTLAQQQMPVWRSWGESEVA
jgi:hypothetical protein